MKIFINGMSALGSGGLTVAHELARHLALCRPDWTIVLALITQYRIHEELLSGRFPRNVNLFWAPNHTVRLQNRLLYEFWQIPRLLRELRIDVLVQLNGMVIPNVTTPTLCQFSDPEPYITFPWKTNYNKIISSLKRRSHRYGLQNARLCGFLSDYLRKLICTELVIQPANVEIFYAGVPQLWLDCLAQKQRKWSTRPMELLSVSELLPHKGHDVVLKALPLIMNRVGTNDLHYRIVGLASVPWYRDKLANEVRQLGLDDVVSFEGRISEAELSESYDRARCFVLMSKCESFGIPALEAMYHGTPVVTSKCCAMPEICGNAAELVDPNDEHAIAEVIYSLMTNEERAEKLAALGRQRITRFSWNLTAEKMASAIEQRVVN